MTTQDHQLYQEYKPLRNDYEFAAKFCEWYENGGRRHILPDWLEELRKKLITINQDLNYTQIGEILDLPATTVGQIIRGEPNSISRDRGERVAERVDQYMRGGLEQIAHEVAEKYSIDPALIPKKDRIVTRVRIDFVNRAFDEGYSDDQIGKYMNRHPSSIRRLKNS